MKVIAVSKEGESRTLDVELSAEEVDQEFRRAYDRYGKSLVVPGFRKGKAPINLLRRKFGNKIQQDVHDTLLKAYSMWAMDEQNVHLIDKPKAESLLPLEEGKPFSFRLELRSNVVPDVRGYDRLRIEVPARREVTEGQVDEMVERLRKRYGTLKPAESPDAEVRLTDRITVDVAFLGLGDDEVLLSASDEVMDVLSATTMLFGIELLGRRSDEEVTGDHTVSDDFPDEKLRGKPVRVRIKVKDIKNLELPPADDSLARMVGETETLQELRGLLARRLQAQYEEEHLRRIDEAMFGKLLENNPVAVDPELLKTRTGRTMLSMIQQGVVRKDCTKEELERMVNSITPLVQETMAREMLIAQIALQEGVDAEQDEIEQAVKSSGERPDVSRHDKDYLVELLRLQLDARKRIIDTRIRHLLNSKLEIEYTSNAPDDGLEPGETDQK